MRIIAPGCRDAAAVVTLAQQQQHECSFVIIDDLFRPVCLFTIVGQAVAKPIVGPIHPPLYVGNRASAWWSQVRPDIGLVAGVVMTHALGLCDT